MSIFRKPVFVIRRQPGTYIDGLYTGAARSQPATVPMGVQPASQADYADVEAGPDGQRYTEMRRAYTGLSDALVPMAKGGAPGDLVLLDGSEWLVMGRVVHDTFGSEVSHVKHLIVRADELREFVVEPEPETEEPPVEEPGVDEGDPEVEEPPVDDDPPLDAEGV